MSNVESRSNVRLRSKVTESELWLRQRSQTVKEREDTQNYVMKVRLD
jgi:hypothetical protein